MREEVRAEEDDKIVPLGRSADIIRETMIRTTRWNRHCQIHSRKAGTSDGLVDAGESEQ
jgi:hypothetical protein